MKTTNLSGNNGDTADLSSHIVQYEALEWLENNGNPYAFAGNRFEDTVSAVEFVRSLYDCGATQVLISGIYDEPSRIAEEGGPYADTLRCRRTRRSGSRSCKSMSLSAASIYVTTATLTQASGGTR